MNSEMTCERGMALTSIREVHRSLWRASLKVIYGATIERGGFNKYIIDHILIEILMAINLISGKSFRVNITMTILFKLIIDKTCDRMDK